MASSVDKLRDKWERISPREQLLVGLLGSSAVVIVLLWVAFTIRDGINGIELKNQRTRDALGALDRWRDDADSRRPTGPKVVIGKEAVDLTAYLDKIAEEVGLTIPGYTRRPPATKGKYTELSTRIAIRGVTVGELKDFLERVEGNNKLVVILDLQVKHNFRSRGGEKLDLDMVVATYKQTEAKPDDKKGGKEG